MKTRYRFVVYRPLSGAWAAVAIFTIHGVDEPVADLGEGTLFYLERIETVPVTANPDPYAAEFAAGLAAGLGHDRGSVKWHWAAPEGA